MNGASQRGAPFFLSSPPLCAVLVNSYVTLCKKKQKKRKETEGKIGRLAKAAACRQSPCVLCVLGRSREKNIKIYHVIKTSITGAPGFGASVCLLEMALQAVKHPI